MDIKEIYKKLEGKCPSNYRINEIIPIAYPYRKMVINATVNKTPEESIQQVYAIFIKAIKSGINTEKELTHFLGLDKDDFILRELYFLRERGYLDFISSKWMITETGEEFIKDNSILKILSEEEFEFYIDAYTDEVLQNDFSFYNDYNVQNKLQPKINLKNKSPELLKGKSEQLADIYKKEKAGKAFLVDYNENEIKFDKEVFNDYYLIEYIPTREKENELEPRIEIRNRNKEYSLNKRLTKILSQEYPNIIYDFTDSERAIVANIELEIKNNEIAFDRVPSIENKSQIESLSIWETKAKFIDAIQSAKDKLLIESPWIKRAALNYIPEIEKALKRKVNVMVLYGIEGNDEHDFKAIREMERLVQNYKNFKLVHLPTHFENTGNKKMVGSHKKLVIKDNEYYIHGSFNFLSFNKNEGQKVANEETLLISLDVAKKWKQVFNQYKINEI
jgi:hypothetical protein